MNNQSLLERYDAIAHRTFTRTSLTESDVEPSRALFELSTGSPVPRRFDVYACVAGLPLPSELIESFTNLRDTIRAKAPEVPFYTVRPDNLHWEVFILQRPGESFSGLETTTPRLRAVFAAAKAVEMIYRGFILTSDGTIIVRGFGAFDDLRAALYEAAPGASSRQSGIGHISLGRFVGPIPESAFSDIVAFMKETSETVFGTFLMDEVNLVHEHQWYMEDRDILEKFPLSQPAE